MIDRLVVSIWLLQFQGKRWQKEVTLQAEVLHGIPLQDDKPPDDDRPNHPTLVLCFNRAVCLAQFHGHDVATPPAEPGRGHATRHAPLAGETVRVTRQAGRIMGHPP